MKPRAIVFDLDGVLWNSSLIHESAFVDVLKKGQYLTEQFNYTKYAGMKSIDVFKGLFPDASSETLRSMCDEKQKYASERLKKANNIINSELERVISSLDGKYMLGICTSSRRENLQIFLEKSGLSQIFSAMITGDEVANAKPDPAIYIKMTQKLQLHPDQVMVVEDSMQGIISARSAGNFVVHLCEPNCKISHKNLIKDDMFVINKLGSLLSLLEIT
jgi:HAD superfamily hydrolase (TIGR01509 family)